MTEALLKLNGRSRMGGSQMFYERDGKSGMGRRPECNTGGGSLGSGAPYVRHVKACVPF